MITASEVFEPGSLTVRRARPEDAEGLVRLAGLDSATVPAGDLIVAEQGDELCAAVSIADGSTIADPFRPTAEVVQLLVMRVRQIRAGGRSRRRDGLPVLARLLRTG